MTGEGPQKIGTVLRELIDSMGMRHKIDAARVVESWAMIAGPEINAYTNRAWLERRILIVQITSAARRHDLHMNRTHWKNRLNAELGTDLIDEIQFR
ncbi:MAG: DUF721 domain-containing protein [Rhodothermales bacterium]